MRDRHPHRLLLLPLFAIVGLIALLAGQPPSTAHDQPDLSNVFADVQPSPLDAPFAEREIAIPEPAPLLIVVADPSSHAEILRVHVGHDDSGRWLALDAPGASGRDFPMQTRLASGTAIHAAQVNHLAAFRNPRNC